MQVIDSYLVTTFADNTETPQSFLVMFKQGDLTLPLPLLGPRPRDLVLFLKVTQQGSSHPGDDPETGIMWVKDSRFGILV